MIERTIDDTRVPVKIWTDEVEPGAEAQLRNLASLPFVFHHVAAMADVHLGYGATIGSVIATQGALSPAAVGVDIGCGMVAQKTTVRQEELSSPLLAKLRREIERSIPVGHHQHREPLPGVAEFFAASSDPVAADSGLLRKASCQLGTLGGGNHFLEVCIDQDDGYLWLLLHSGSRNIGKSLAEIHINRAKGLMKRALLDLKDPDLASLSEGTEEFRRYLHDVHWCQDYARKNRDIMMDVALQQLAFALGRGGDARSLPAGERVNCHHNYVSRERHFGREVLVTRKGAIRARRGEMGIIPGSMGTGSFIVRGLGNPESFESAPHGAGRRLSRTAARKSFTVEDLKRQTEGVECRKDAGVLDEIPTAYKDIDSVIRKSSDLVEVVARLKQVLCVKG